MGENLMKISICFIGTSKYINFLPNYYENVHKYFLPGVEKQFLVFTDGEGNFPNDIKIFPQEHLDWPFITLKRFEFIQRAEKYINDSDLFVFLDADALVVDKISEDEFLFDKPFFGVHHPCHFLQMPPHNKFPGAFETDKNSIACINSNDNLSVYYQGCFWGGKSPKIMEMINELSNRVNIDLENNVIAKWHDESHLNKFFIENQKDVHVFGPEYAYPEVFEQYCDFEPKIIHLAKDNSKYQV